MKKEGIKLFDSERKVMEVLWEYGEISASKMVKILAERTGWNRNTTYTVIKKCVEKECVKRIEPHFICQAVYSKEDIQIFEINELRNKMFHGSNELFLEKFLQADEFSEEEKNKLIEIIQNAK